MPCCGIALEKIGRLFIFIQTKAAMYNIIPQTFGEFLRKP